MATGIILALFAGLPWWLPALVSVLHRLGVVAEWEVPEKRPVGNTDEPPAPGKVGGGTVVGKLPRRLSEQEATEEEFLAALNDGPDAAEIVAQEGLESVDAEVVEFNLADAYAKAEVSMEQQAARMERMRKEIEERKKKMK